MSAAAVTATILTVEDDPVVRADIGLILEDAGFLVCPARDGVEAIDLARSHRPDLILMDLGLPRIDGVDATAQILAERDVPVVALTGRGNRDGLARAVKAGTVAHVAKPFSHSQLIGTISEVLADREREHAHLRVMIESMLRGGCSESEIVTAVEQATGNTRPVPPVSRWLPRVFRRLRRCAR